MATTLTKNNSAAIGICRHKDFDESFQRLYKLGGQNQKKFEKIAGIIEILSATGTECLKKLPVTNHGETRIKSCVKIDIGGGFRIITQQTRKFIFLLFTGNHDACEDWLNGNKGIEIVHDKETATLLTIRKSNPNQGIFVNSKPIPSTNPLLDKLNKKLLGELLIDVPSLVVLQLSKLSGFVSTDQIIEICAEIDNHDRQILVQDVLCFLAADDRENAIQRLAEFARRTVPIDAYDESEVLEIEDGDVIRRLVVGSEDYRNWLNRLSREGDHLEWLLFMHPEQRRIVDEDFDGSAQLSGISGSGKTCIAVQRAIRLASADDDESVLLVTLNKTLAGLISNLVDGAAVNEGIRSRIKVTSFFELCQELLAEFEPDRIVHYDAVSWKLNEHIDEVFREYYRCWTNLRTAKILRPIHQSLCAQGISAEAYLREEFDWIRSALPKSRRASYTNAKKFPRIGRAYPLQEQWRKNVLEGLAGWEDKMEAVGVIDYLGLTTAVMRYEKKLSHRFSKIIVDEAQDFGTTELSILRRLAPDGSNDLFLCGDIAQHVLPKHRVMTEAGIKIANRRRRRIRRNYRNTRQILEAAYEILCQNLHDEMLDCAERDLEILDPSYANRSSNQPLVLGASSLEEEIGYARGIVASHLDQNSNAHCCIAFAGYSMCEVERYALKLELHALDGSAGFLSEPLVLSDLEQTKGYEFDLVIIVNCCKDVLPRHDTPAEEVYRDGCRLYVAMTRAKDDLYLSYHGQPSPWLNVSDGKLTFYQWLEVEDLNPIYLNGTPDRIPEAEHTDHCSPNGLTGEEYCYSSFALGMTREAQLKLCDLVDGRGMTRNGRRVKWRTIGDLGRDLESDPQARAIVGRVISGEIRKYLRNYAPHDH